ncbi:MAG: hypothetical protein A2Z88_06470 [Omnitrophica WOR_2 bacterium GWA2_47_8]|nr:MAG: hypothetical protein A2Z88_06470 [Omnitrophica WOR_2 bacterium GWA2_47_8]
MTPKTDEKKGFRFYTRLNLSGLTGLKAATLEELLQHIKEVPGSCIYHHTHRFLQQHQYLSPEPPNDFAYWVTHILGDDRLGEDLASIDTVQFTTIRELREKIVTVIEEYLKKYPSAKRRFVNEEQAFSFIKSMSFILPTHYIASNLREFIEILRKVTIDSIYFHIFEARLRLEKKSNDFSNWIESFLGDKELAEKIAQLDPYTQTLEDLRQALIRILERKLK